MTYPEGDRPEESTAASTDSAALAPEPQVPARPPVPSDWQSTRPEPTAAPQGETQPTVPLAGPATPPPYRAPETGYAGQSFGVQPEWAAAAPSTTAAAVAERPRSGAGLKVAGFIVAAALVGGAAGLGGAYAGTQLWGSSGTSTTAEAGPATVTVNDTTSVNQTTAIAAKVTPSVVTISASDGSSSGTGSGVVLTSDGYVVTNTHVVTLDGATGSATLSVTTSDGHVYAAEVVGTDPTYDIAVIKLTDASGLTPIEFGDSSNLNVGDETVAVGAPLGLSNTVTTGIVSALNRSIQIASSAAPDSTDSGDSGDQNNQESPFQFDFGQGETGTTQATQSISISVIQTDAAINPGNSGGALVDGEGKLIGINVAIASAGGSSSSSQSGSIGVGFSIPSDVVKRISDEIIANGSATHGLLGASVQATSAVEGTDITGAYISEVTAGGAAASAGLTTGDIVTEFNGVPVTDATDLTAQVRAAAAGSEATLTYVRDGETRTATVTLGSLSDAG